MHIHPWLESTLTVAVVAFALCLAACERDKVTAPPAPTMKEGAISAQGDWPRRREKGGQVVTVYEPQVQSWDDYKSIAFVAAVAVVATGSKQAVYGAADVQAETHTDFSRRTVVATNGRRQLRFPTVSQQEQARLAGIVDELMPPRESVTVPLDLVLAYVRSASSKQTEIPVNLQPPKIFYSQEPAILVIFMGAPQLKPIAGTSLMFVVNTNWDVLYDPASSRYFLLNGDSWLTTLDPAIGAWAATAALPASFSELPGDANWQEVKMHVADAKTAEGAVVFSTTEPAEMILVDGPPNYTPIPGTQLLYVTNSDSVLILHATEQQHYYLVAGRWFRAKQLGGPWSAATENLPADFLDIPEDHALAPIRASVPGTAEANDAILLASVPATTQVRIGQTAPEQVAYEGAPKFRPVSNTSVQYAVNTPNDVFLVEGRYYWVYQGIWYCGDSPQGAWSVCTSVPQRIYQIPPSHPKYSVTYVHVYESTPTTVTTGYTSGYKGEYVAAGVLLFGVGMLVGDALDDDDDYYHYGWPPPPALYPYGGARHYSYAYGGYYSAAHAYGPHGSAGAWRGYNPSTGTYARGSYASGPYGSAGRGAAYNPYTGGAAAGRQVSTAFGSAGGYAAFNPYTGVRTRGAYATRGEYSRYAQASSNPRTGTSSARTGYSTPESSASRGYARQGDDWVRGGQKSTSDGTVGGIQTSEGGAAAGVETDQGRAAFARTGEGDVYVGHDGNVYKKNESGRWQQNTEDGWQEVESRADTSRAQSLSEASDQATVQRPNIRSDTTQTQRSPVTMPSPQPASGTRAPRTAESSTYIDVHSQLNRDATARQRGEQLTARSRSFQAEGFGGGAPRNTGRRR